MGNFINTDLLPLEVSDSPWLYENNNEGAKSVDTGKWMLFYDKSLMNEAWVLSKKLYRENKVTDLEKCVILLQILTFVGDDLYDKYANAYPGSCERSKAENFLRDNAGFIDY